MDALRNWLWQRVQDAARLERAYRVRGRALDAGEAGHGVQPDNGFVFG